MIVESINHKNTFWVFNNLGCIGFVDGKHECVMNHENKILELVVRPQIINLQANLFCLIFTYVPVEETS
jgi:hypothetical protein